MVRRRHLVSLLGHSIENSEKLFVYEYMPQGALSSHLFHWKKMNLEPFSWRKRITFALDVAGEMEYLHIGLVNLAPDGKKSVATKLAGTFGYLAPEYAAISERPFSHLQILGSNPRLHFPPTTILQEQTSDVSKPRLYAACDFVSNLMAYPSELGLRVLLCPFGSNIVVRTACCCVGIALPVYSTFKAIEKKDQNEQQQWLLYWAAYGSFSIAEAFTDKLISWFPLYYHMKFAFLVWLQLPSADGARHLYMRHLRPLLLRHQARLDQIVDFVYGELSKFVSAHQSEIQFAKSILMKILAPVKNVVHPPARRHANAAIEGPSRQVQDSESDKEE
ncbi:hypothetical protein FNV43_RR22704 [Rhamnella rubrinervis]|uniref:Serine-threonine/tyrosine-protein kinase catalytic domain-containing protein n=1 Tax=Rhamnella rubrinervis TaxID=2594499 RepID=A0A8K0GSQ7_9ROSA|nr:hypothetical protein FNV43_RR22704 [Rhamnella rubrinervis]